MLTLDTHDISHNAQGHRVMEAQMTKAGNKKSIIYNKSKVITFTNISARFSNNKMSKQNEG